MADFLNTEGNEMTPNEPPIGALPKEVADDVPINASEGEYILPADVVRYLGLEYIEKLVQRAKKGLQEKDEQGRIGGEETPPEGLPEAPVPGAPAMAAGGLVKDNYTGIRQYKDATGNVVQIPFANGEPIMPIPQGAQMVSQSDGINMPQDSKPKLNFLGEPEGQRDGGRDAPNMQSPLAGSPTDWAAKDFETFAKSQNSVGERMAKNLVGMATGPIGALASQARSRYLSREVPDIMKEMISTGMDPAGNKLSPEQLSRMKEIQPQIEANFAQAKNNPTNKAVDNAFRGFSAMTSPAGPIAGLAGAAVNAGISKVAEKAFDAVEAAADSVKDKNKELADKTAKDTQETAEAAADKGSASGSGSDSGGAAGGDSGNTTRDKKDEDKPGYRKGGLVTRKNQKPIKMAKGGLVKRKC